MSNPYADFMDELRKDPDKLKAFMRKVTGPASRTLAGQEYNDIMLLLKLTTPYKQSNNQHTWTDEYKLAGKLYHVTYGLGTNPIIDEVDEDETLTR